MDLDKWAVTIQCHCCALQAEITYADIEFKDTLFQVTCPTARCGVQIQLIEARIPRVVRLAVKQHQQTTTVN